MNTRFITNMQAMRTMTVLALCLGAATTASAQAPVLESNPNTKRMEAAIYQYFQGAQTLNPQIYASAFAHDGTIEDPAGTTPVQGRAAIATFFGGLTQAFGRLTGRVKDIYVGAGNSNDATASWTLTLYTKQGKQVILHGIGVFTFKPSNSAADSLQIAYLREFWDPVELTSQLQ